MTSALAAPSAELLGRIYRSAFDESEFHSVLCRIASELNTHHSALMVQDHFDPEASLLQHNVNGEAKTSLYSHYADRDVLLQASEPHMLVGRVVSHNRYLPDSQLMRSDFYEGFCRRVDVHHGMTGLLYRDHRKLVMLCAARQRSAPFKQEDVRWLESLVPHLRNAIDVAQRVRRLRLENAAAWAVLDRQPFGVQIYDEVHRPVFRNKTLDTMVANSGLLSFRGGRLDASAAHLSNWLACPADIVRALLERGRPMSTTAQHGDERYHFVLAPFEVEVGFLPRTFFALFVNDPNAVAPNVQEQLRILYRMTERESAVAMCLASGASTREAAHHFHLAESTIVTYRKKIYAKMRVTRQVELVRLVGSMQA